MDLKQVISHCKEYGFVYQSSEIYDGLAAVYDYGPYGVALKNNLKEYWWKSMVQLHENIVGIDTAIFMHPKTWKASGHVDAFNDPLIDNKDSKKRYRADQLLEEYIEKLDNKIEKEVSKAKKRFGDQFDEKLYRETNPRVVANREKRDRVNERMVEALAKNDLVVLKSMIEEYEIACPVSGTKNWTDVRYFNLMFSTQLGNIAGEEEKLYLRPETAQGIFVNFLNVQKTARQKIPFGIAQIGKAFRNEIVARQFIFRMREFEQMEMQFFIQPGKEMEWYKYWKDKRMDWHKAICNSDNMLDYHDHENLAHYANAAVDIQYKYPFGFREVEGIHSRTDFDLKSHQELSGKKLQYFDPEHSESYIPYVVETSIGCDRIFLAQLCNSLQSEMVPDAKGNETERIVMKIHPALAPIKCAVLPLLKNKPELVNYARNLYDDIKLSVQCNYDEKDAIGRRYRRQDAIGTPLCATIDFESLENDTVTLRDRDNLQQTRVSVKDLARSINEKTNIASLLAKV